MYSHADHRPMAVQSVVSAKITATAVTASAIHRFEVDELTVTGARLRGSSQLPRRKPFDIIVHVPFYPPIRLRARVTQRSAGGCDVHFIHDFDFTEDQIQAALLSELERSHTVN